MASQFRNVRTKKDLYSCDFEVHGKVMGVLFNTYLRKQARFLGLRGWCMHSEAGTVKGHMEGPHKQLILMKYWLQNNGSPKSVIEKAEFTETTPIGKFTFRTFSALRKFLYSAKMKNIPWAPNLEQSGSRQS